MPKKSAPQSPPENDQPTSGQGGAPPSKRARTRGEERRAADEGRSKNANPRDGRPMRPADGRRPNSAPSSMMMAPPPFIVRLGGSRSDDKTDFSDEEKRYMQKLSSEENERLKKMIVDIRPNKEPRRLRVLRSNLPLPVKADIFRQLAETESAKYEDWVENALKLPLGKFTPRPDEGKHAEFIREARERMDAEITGHVDAKHEVLRLICSWLNNGGSTGFALGLEGEPGVGKTTFVKRALSSCMNRPFCFISLGGASDASGMLGHSYTYEGAVPGRLAECLTRCGVMDPIIFFDELDKISHTGKGEELVHALIHLTDPVQNDHIRDRYLHGIDLDLSRAVLVFSYNDPSRVNPILLDRIKRIRMNAPTSSQRFQICAQHLVPRIVTNTNPLSDMRIPDDVIEFVIENNAGESGMRSIEKDLSHIISSYSLVKTYGSSDVLGLSHEAGTEVRLDVPFARSVLLSLDVDRKASTSHLLMYS